MDKAKSEYTLGLYWKYFAANILPIGIEGNNGEIMAKPNNPNFLKNLTKVRFEAVNSFLGLFGFEKKRSYHPKITVPKL